MIRSRAAFRFWTAMSAAPAAIASMYAVTSCGGGGDSRPPEAPITPLVVGSGGPAAPLEVSPPPPGEETGANARACNIDHYAASQCMHVQALAPTKEGANDSRQCPVTTSTSSFYTPFGGKTTARLDGEKTDEMSNGMCCYDWCEPIRVNRNAPKACTPPLHTRMTCFEMPERGTTAPAPAPFDRCPVGITVRDLDGQKGSFSGRFEPTASATGDAGTARCCYAVCGPMQMRPVIGRPPRDGDSIVVASAIASDTWPSAEHAREGNSQIPLEDALLEHASVAAFTRLSLSLLAFGAPPDLVARSHEAALDEIRHAQISFARAGRSIGPGPCPAFANLRAHRSLADLAEETYVDGCIGETIASLKLRVHASDETLLAMARDEERHAELAWRIVEWAIAVGGEEIRERVARVAEGRQTNDDVLARWAHENVIVPCSEMLLQAA